MRKQIFQIFFSIVSFSTALPAMADDFANNVTGTLNAIGGGAYGSAQPANIYDVIGQILAVVLSFVGIVFVAVTLQGGFLWMTAGGNEEQVRQARDKILNGALGAIIIFATYLITAYVLSYACEYFTSASSCG